MLFVTTSHQHILAAHAKPLWPWWSLLRLSTMHNYELLVLSYLIVFPQERSTPVHKDLSDTSVAIPCSLVQCSLQPEDRQ